MSSKMAVSLQNVGKMYRMYPTRLDMALDVTGLIRFFPRRKARAREFWALRNINLDIRKGERLGIIGRNGAGKTTMLKLLTGNLGITEGEIDVNGNVQALLTSGSGFHPEFTGYENIRSSLVYQGLDPDQIEAAVKDIAEFTELGDFLSQPFKLYSSGMQARLTFAAATVLNPDILIVDEILGAGDAYFAGKSLERMKNLVEDTGATVLIVSHALDQILQYCDECIWMERGRIVQRGPSLEIVKAYEQFINVLEDRRLKAKNYKKNTSKQYDVNQLENFSDNLLVRFCWQGTSESYCDIGSVRLLKNNTVEDEILVGDAQDSSSAHSAYVQLHGGNWSAPMYLQQRAFRRLNFGKVDSTQKSVFGDVVFYMHAIFADAAYTLEFDCSTAGSGTLVVETWKDQIPLSSNEVSTRGGWEKLTLPLHRMNRGQDAILDKAVPALPDADQQGEALNRVKRRWPGKASVFIDNVSLLGEDGAEKTVFNVGSRMFVRVKLKAANPICLDLVLVAVLYRLDGIMISKFRTPSTKVDLSMNDTQDFQLEIGSIDLGNHNFVFSLGLFEDMVDGATRLDLLDRSFEFRVVGNEDYYSQAIIKLPGEWRML